MASSILVSFIIICAGSVNAFKCPSVCKCSSGKKNWTVCEERGLEVLPSDMDPFTNLLDLSGNFFHNLPNDTFANLGLTRLESIVMKRSGIATIEQRAFVGLNDLKVLDLSNNSIRSLNASVFSGLISLIELNLANNSLKSVGSGWFFKSPALLTLSLSGNPIEYLADSPFINVPALRVLDLSNCTLASLESQSFSNLMELKTLDLSRNALATLPKDFFVWLQKLEHLRLDGNPWRCDCNIQVVTTVLMLRGFHDSIENLTCAYQSAFDVYRWRDMNKTHVQEDCVPHIENHLKKVIMTSGNSSIKRGGKTTVFQFMNTTAQFSRRISSHLIDPWWILTAITLLVCFTCLFCACKLCARKRAKPYTIYNEYDSSEDGLIDEKSKFNDHFYLVDEGSSDMSVSVDI